MLPLWTNTQTLCDTKGPVHCAVFSAGSGAYLITGAQDRVVRLWNPRTGTLVKSYQGHGYEVLGVAPSHDNTRLASCGGDRSVFYWDVATGQPIKRFAGHTSRINTVAFNAESTVLASGSFDASVRLWDLKSQQRLPIQIFEDAKDSITSLIVTNHDIIVGSVDGHVRWYDLRAGELYMDYFENPVTSLSLTKDKQTLLVSTLDSTIRLMDVNNGTVLQTFKGHKNDSYRIKACLDSKEANVITGDENGNLFTFDLVEGTCLGKQDTVTGGKSVLWTAHHPSTAEKMLVTAGGDGEVKIWQKND